MLLRFLSVLLLLLLTYVCGAWKHVRHFETSWRSQIEDKISEAKKLESERGPKEMGREYAVLANRTSPPEWFKNPLVLTSPAMYIDGSTIYGYSKCGNLTSVINGESLSGYSLEYHRRERDYSECHANLAQPGKKFDFTPGLWKGREFISVEKSCLLVDLEMSSQLQCELRIIIKDKTPLHTDE